jgi:hypothetical protein
MLEIYERLRRPECFVQFLASNQLSVALQEHLQDLKRLTRQMQPYALLSQFLRLYVRLKWAEADNGLGILVSRHEETSLEAESTTKELRSGISRGKEKAYKLFVSAY